MWRCCRGSLAYGRQRKRAAWLVEGAGDMNREISQERYVASTGTVQLPCCGLAPPNVLAERD